MNLNYLSHLTIKKSKTAIYSKFEKKVQSEAITDSDTFIFFLIKEIFKDLIVCKNVIYYKTEITNNEAPLILGQTRLICLLCDSFNKENVINSGMY